MGAELQEGFSSHYVKVARKMSSPRVCQTAKDYEKVEGAITYFPVEANGINCFFYFIHPPLLIIPFSLLQFVFFFDRGRAGR